MRQFGPFSLLLLAAFFWGTGNVAQKTVLAEMGPMTAVGLRCLVGCFAVLPFVWGDLMGGWAVLRGKAVLASAVCGVFAAAIGLQQWSYAGTTVSNASFLVSTTTVMTPLVSWLAFRARPASWTILCSIATFTGVAMMAGGSISALSWGDGVCLLSAFCYAIWFVLLGRLVVQTGRPGLITLAQLSFTGIAFLGIGMLVEAIKPMHIVIVLPDLLYLGVFATGFAFVLQAWAQQKVSATVAAVATSAESVFGAAAANILLAEQMTSIEATGAAVILMAIIAVQVSPCGFARVDAN